MNVIVRANPTLRGIHILESEVVAAITAGIHAGVTAAEESAKDTTLWHDQSGETRKSIRGEVTSGTSGFVEAGGASGYLQNGTRPASAVRTAAMLINGEVLFRRFKHPGIAARPFMTEARERGAEAAAKAVELYIGEAIRRVL
jgi:hypothetical protein